MPLPHLPQVPENFIKIAHNLMDENPNGPKVDAAIYDPKMNLANYDNRKLYKDGKIIESRKQKGHEMPLEWNQWVRDNIVPEFIETSLRISVGNSETHGAHCDFGRKWKLYYLLERGGNDATTYFFKQKGFPIVREDCDNSNSLITVTDYSELEVIESVQWPLNSWVALNTMILHGVDNIVERRSNFTISIPTDYRLLFKN